MNIVLWSKEKFQQVLSEYMSGWITTWVGWNLSSVFIYPMIKKPLSFGSGPDRRVSGRTGRYVCCVVSGVMFFRNWARYIIVYCFYLDRSVSAVVINVNH